MITRLSSCNVMLWYAVLCCAMICYASPQHGISLSHAVSVSVSCVTCDSNLAAVVIPHLNVSVTCIYAIHNKRSFKYVTFTETKPSCRSQTSERQDEVGRFARPPKLQLFCYHHHFVNLSSSIQFIH